MTLQENIPVTLLVNDTEYPILVSPGTTLLEALRENIGLMGTKEGCGHGDCGVCVVLLDGKAVNSCLVFALDARERRITTIEGLSTGNCLHPLQEAFLTCGAVQCGFCTSGMVLSAKALLDTNPDADEETIRNELSGVLCRCGTYPRVVEAVRAVGRKMSRQGGGV